MDQLQAGDLVCLSHLRWGFVFQRPNHLMSRFAQARRTFFVEEPVFESGITPRMDVETLESGLYVCVPKLPQGLSPEEVNAEQRRLLGELMRERSIAPEILWFYTPMALEFANDIDAKTVVYDCMDELSLFHGAPPRLRQLEEQLFRRADVVFTGGQSLYQSKKKQHHNVHCFPSSVDAHHYRKARGENRDPEDQALIPQPRAGYFGVIDERIDLELLATLADARPELQIVMLGPVVKIDPNSLPHRPNIHWLGMKRYEELPSYVAGWNFALMPFALNDSTRFISPTKTLEYLAAGKPIVSTAIRDVVTPYGDDGLVRIADRTSIVRAADAALRDDLEVHRAMADAYLARTSWDSTWARMNELLTTAIRPSSRKDGGASACSTI